MKLTEVSQTKMKTVMSHLNQGQPFVFIMSFIVLFIKYYLYWLQNMYVHLCSDVSEHRVDAAILQGLARGAEAPRDGGDVPVVVGVLGAGLGLLGDGVPGLGAGAAGPEAGEEHREEHEAVEHSVHHGQAKYLRNSFKVTEGMILNSLH